ncbi:hypothetical protein [Saccharothrix sp. NRRL B-16314]|uniref:hypothetical protein n=1 Tax=Saccharothrix sp. NRRL B-16314 TaxID=1463825 RepID=UPI000525A0A5|nr:hypothetical protein [Saccharothrix sp. NRRL B-16314]
MVPRDRRAHLTYTEPGGWTSPGHCLEDQAAAEDLRDATNLLSGRSAAARRVWSITSCPGDDCGVQR